MKPTNNSLQGENNYQAEEFRETGIHLEDCNL